MRKFLFALLFVVPLAAEDRGPINSNLPEWINFTFQDRVRSEGQHGVGFREGNDQDFLLQRTRLGVGFKPLSWLQFYGEVHDARAFWFPRADGSVKDRLDLRQAYASVGSEAGWWDLKVGRQRLIFGTERVIGAGEWGNTARVFDAARFGIHHGSDRVDVFASSVVNNDADHPDHHTQGNNLHGVYGSFGSWIQGAKIEPYVLLRTTHTTQYHSWTKGLRAAGVWHKVWNYEFEGLAQSGSTGPNRLSAWGATAQVQHRWDSWRWKPSVIGEFNYASGDKRPGDGVVQTLDQLYPTNHGFYGIADQVGRRNNENVRGGVWLRPEKWLTVKTELHSFWLASRYDGLYAFNGALIAPAVGAGADSRDVGREMDIIGDVKLSRHYDIGAQYGHLFPGPFLKHYSPGAGRGFYAVFVDFRL